MNETVLILVEEKTMANVTMIPQGQDPLAADWLSQSDKIGFLFLLSIICSVAFFGNALVLTIAVKSSKMRTTNNCFIFNLAFCDFVVGCFSIPVMITTLLAERWVFGATMCNITAFVDNMVMMESIWTLATLSAFRAMSVLDPFRVKQVL
ncbi:somatostatin receptor type 1-like [Bolinopsis microptera]|uniref:somatostatin receptor type 1-like n=1 Tax=Bolinopsis microptera TaxID=2820187 RepID=UPI00307A2683